MRTASRIRALAVLSAAAAVLVGCTAEQAPEPTAAPISPPAVRDLAATAWVRADAADVASGGDLNLALAAWPATFNTFRATGAPAETRALVAPTSGGPFNIDASGQPVIDPDYALSVELTSDSPFTIEVTLNPRAVWEDGTPITVSDYVATWKALNGTDASYRAASHVGYEDVASVEAGADEYHVVITFRAPFPDWPSILTGVLKASIADDPAVFNEGFDAAGMPSNGPFVFSEIDPNEQTVVLERNPLWWGDIPKLERILFETGNAGERAAAFADGDIDALAISSDAELYERARTREDAEMQAARSVEWAHVTMNGREGPLADANVRKAVASIVNREQIAASANTPVGVPAMTQDDVIFLPGQDGYTDEALPYDLDAGAAFLEEAGYGRDGDSWVKDGESLELSVTVPADAVTDIRRAEQVRDDLGEFGIPVELITVPAAGYFSDHVVPGDFEIVSFSRVGGAFPISTTEPLFSPLASEQNVTGITDESLGDLWDRANTELDPEARIEIANEINAVIWKYVPMFPIAPLPNVYAVTDGLVNYGAAQFETIDWTIVGWAAE